jgi:hypothetical protein
VETPTDDLPWLSLRVRELPDGQKVAEVMHKDFALGLLPLHGWTLDGGPERYGTLTVRLSVEEATVRAGEFRSEPLPPAALRTAGLREGRTDG